MGNAIITGAGGGRKAKIMKINGEFFKLGTPAKVGDVIHSYPGHVLLDSDEFLRINLRARPLDPEFELRPKKIYLLVELPRFPTSDEADCTNSGDSSTPPENSGNSEASVSDLSAIGRSEAVRVKLKLPKAEVERILEQSSDGAEAAERIIDLCAPATAVAEEEGRWTEIGDDDETTEKLSFGKYRVKLDRKLRAACSGQRSEYKKLTNE